MSESLTQGVLTPFDIQTVEGCLDIELRDPQKPQLHVRQQFGVFLRIGTHLGDVMSEGRYFTYTELRDKVKTILDTWIATTFTQQKPDLSSIVRARDDDDDERNIKPKTRRN